MNAEATVLLRDGLAALGVSADAVAEERFGHLLALLQDANTRVNLTALKTERDIVVKHFVDSASCLRGGHLGSGGRVIDIGTGAGFPALPLAILDPERDITALDSIRKKVEFVRAAAGALDLAGVQPRVGRAETLGRDPADRATFDRVVVRAVAALPILVELALPLLRVGGRLVAQKGPASDEELAAGARAARELGGEIVVVDSFELPVTGDARRLIVVEKTAPTPDRYPRREGIPTQQPLFWTAK